MSKFEFKLLIILIVLMALISYSTQQVKANNQQSIITLNVLGNSILLDESEIEPGANNSINLLRYGLDYESFGDLNYLIGAAYQSKRTRQWDISSYSLRVGSMTRTDLKISRIEQLRELGILIDAVSDFSTFGVFAELSLLDTTYYTQDSVASSQDLIPAVGAYYKIYAFDRISRLGYSFHIDTRLIAADQFMKRKTSNLAISLGGGIAYSF